MQRCAVVLMNLGGPDSPAAVRPFLYNLFSDRAIIDLPAPLRQPLASLIAWRRARVAGEIYAALGGGSPLLPNTRAQAMALEKQLGPGYRCFIAMRYWPPLTAETVAAVRDWRPDEIVLLPLYPQYSSTTSGSSLTEWRTEAASQGLAVKTHAIRSFADAAGFAATIAAYVDEALRTTEGPTRLLFSAHGLPLRIVRAGDPYPLEVVQTANAVIASMSRKPADWRICYQSRVGPLPWLSPSLDEELRRAARDGLNVVVVPISFVSEHSETLVELDRDYRRRAESYGVRVYRRIATVGTEPLFIAALADLVRAREIGGTADAESAVPVDMAL